MTRFLRSKSAGLAGIAESYPTRLGPDYDNDSGEDEIEDEEEEEEDDQSTTTDGDDSSQNPISTPFIAPGWRRESNHGPGSRSGLGQNQSPSPLLDILAALLRKSLVTCSVERDDVAAMDIGWPTEVKHVSHVTFDRFNGFLGLPTELEPEVPRRAPSASVSVFGVSAKSMQCSYDGRGNSVPTILLMMQKRLYAEGGLKAEGIFRINPENSQEECVRHQLNRGVVPRGIDVHCLAGLIKAWFRELPTGVLDLLTPEQVMRCNTEDDCTRLVMLLPPVESALLDWAINLMADVVEHEEYNKMNARNVAMVFAPNMTQMADPLTALIQAVQVMNFLKTLILKNLRERERADEKVRSLSSFSATAPLEKKRSEPSDESKEDPCHQNTGRLNPEKPSNWKFLRVATLCRLEADNEGEFWNLQKKDDFDAKVSDFSGETEGLRSACENGDRLSLKEGVRRLCRHSVFQLSKAAKKTRDPDIVNARKEGRRGEACAS